MAKNVVIVFTDLVGSTALASRVGPERAEELRSENFRLLRAALRPHLGREVKNLGDGLMIVFSNSSAAFSAGVAIQQAFHARNRFAADGERFDIRVGISSGEAYQEDGDFFGPPVVEASRLCGICDGGQILTSALVKSLVGTRGGFTFEGLGTRELKGLVEPVEVFAIGWEPLPDTTDPDLGVSFRRDSDRRVALPARLTPSPGAIFAGRVAERARWDDAWKDAAAGERRLWLLGGEPASARRRWCRVSP
ncbi:MAG: adenylate/guanylate cyclase domain-containing protein [Actinomycetota bacterium]|nr:adenylate/guanylate cyclase domain-containing protein [Actinomycetota bacterium]